MFAGQLEFIQSLHKIRTPLLDTLIKLCDFFDSLEFFFILIPIIWLGISWKWGMRLFYLLALSQAVNSGLKHLFALPRPFHLDPAVGIIHVKGYGFPSGAAQTALLLSGLLVLHWKSRWKWVVAIAYTALLSFSRLYLGVHFPIDILGGWIVGLLLLGVYIFLFPKIEGFFERRSALHALLISYFLLFTALFLLPSSTMARSCACGIGLSTGVFLSRWVKLDKPKTKLPPILIAIAGIFALYHFVEKNFNLQAPFTGFLLYFSLGLWISFGALYICGKWATLYTKKS